MKNTLTFTFSLLLTITASAQQYGWAKTVLSGGGTNVYHSFTLDPDDNPVVAGGAEDFSGGASDGLVLMKYNKTDGLRTWLKKYNGRTNSEAFNIHTDPQGNIYYFGTFTDYIAFGSDTVFTNDKVNWNRANYVIAKFNSDGEHIWSKSFGLKSFGESLSNVQSAHFTGTEFVALIGFETDSLFYNRTFIEKLPVKPTFNLNYCLVKINLADGNLNLFKNIGKYESSAPKFFDLNADGTYEFGIQSIVPVNFESQMLFMTSTLSTDGSTMTPKDTIRFVPATFGLTDLFDVLSIRKVSGKYYMLMSSNTNTGKTVFGTDTIKTLPSAYNLRTGAIAMFSSYLDFEKAVRFHWTNENPMLKVSNEKLIIPTRFTLTMYIEDDSITSRNNQHSWGILTFSTTLDLLDSFQVNTNNSSSGGFDFREAKYDQQGNLYVMATHGKDLVFGGSTVFAASKSWDHITMLAKRETSGGSSGLNTLETTPLSVYPNPANTILHLGKALEQVEIYTLQGQRIAVYAHAAEIPVGDLQNGLYLIKALSGKNPVQTRFIKN